MIAGAVMLLIAALMEPAFDIEPPKWVNLVVSFTAYGLLSVGFLLAMRARHEAAELKAKKTSVAPSEEQPQDEGGH